MKSISGNIRLGLASVAVATAAAPLAAFAVSNLRELVTLILDYFNLAIYFIMALAIVFFMWNVFKYFFKADGDKTEAGQYVMYSVIGFAVMLTFWGLVNLVINTFQLNNSSPAGVTVPISGIGSSGGAGASGSNTTFLQRLTGRKK